MWETVRRRSGDEDKEEAAAMKEEKDNQFIMKNEDANSHAGMSATENHRLKSAQQLLKELPGTHHPQAGDSPSACSDNQLSQHSPKTP